MNKQELKITLKSDLCAGSGYSYAGIVDSDICYDEVGLPYIPGKRLKGCMREAAELIGLSETEINRLFGIRGAERPNGVFLGNAYIENYEEIHKELQGLEKSLKEYVTPQSVLEQFSIIKAQTKIMENGVAKDNSLRFTRAMKQYSPLNQKEEMKFYANITYQDMDDNDCENFKMVVKALRNIGMNRNRGLGSVKCELGDEKNSDLVQIPTNKIDDMEEMYVLEYAVRNVAPLILSTDNDYSSEKYISGQNVLGYFASAYLRDGNLADGIFEEIFLKNNVLFSALYPSDGQKRLYTPAPSYINRLKKTKQYVNVSKQIPITETECDAMKIEADYARGNGNQPKKLKGKFVHIDGKTVLVKEVESDIVYHHTKKDEMLYSFEAIRPGQIFAGTITGQGKYLSILCKLLKENQLQFGKSKSSQYGACVLEGDCKIRKLETKETIYPKGSKILVTLLSDGIFTNKVGYTVDCEEVRDSIKNALGIESKENMETYSEIEVRKQMGYYAKWNLRRQAIPVVRAGSTFEFVLEEDLSVSEGTLYAGEKRGEGYGRLCIVENTAEDCRMSLGEKEVGTTVKPDKTKNLCKQILVQEMKEALHHAALKENVLLKNPSTLGRITLMLTESMNTYPDEPAKAYENFLDRIDSIKDEKKRTAIEKIRIELISESRILSFMDLKFEKYIRNLTDAYSKLDDGQMQGELEAVVMGLWSYYFMNVLVQEKYRQKGRQE